MSVLIRLQGCILIIREDTEEEDTDDDLVMIHEIPMSI
jgi:hypothetical protein